MIYQCPEEDRVERFKKTLGYSRNTPIVIDNGSWQCRAGYATSSSPYLRFDNLFAKHKLKRGGTTVHLVGDDLAIDASAKAIAKSPYDGAIVNHWDAMEGVLDHVFLKLGLEGQEAVENPIVMTETISNLMHSRRLMSELLFESYGVPSVAYGIDCLFSFYQNGGKDGLVISVGHGTTHVVPVLGGKGDMHSVKRLSLGASSVPNYMLSLAQLKYPGFPVKVSASQAVNLAREHCYVSSCYDQELKTIMDEKLKEVDRCIQFPYTSVAEPVKSETDLAKAAERKKEASRRLQEQAVKKRMEKLIQSESDLSYYAQLRDMAKTMTKKDYKQRLEGEDTISDEKELNAKIAKLESWIKKARNKDLGIEEEESVAVAPVFDLVDVPDDQLDEQQIKAKKGQKLHKAGYEARQRAKAEKEAERERLRKVAAADVAKRETDIKSWILEKRIARQQLLDRIRDRKRLKAELSDRKSLASQMRMKNIAGLASTEGTTSSFNGKRKRKNDDDTFGADDSDWHVYRDIVNASDSEDEEEDVIQVRSLESELLAYDTSFSEKETIDAKSDPANSLLHAYLHGPYDPEAGDSIQRDYQLHLNVERIRCPEILFRPSLVGMDQSGLVEICKDLLSRLSIEQRHDVVNDFYTTGGGSCISGFKKRLEIDLCSVLSTGANMHVRGAQDPLLDAWRGAAKWAGLDRSVLKSNSVTRAEYDEMGPEYMKEHDYGNISLGE